MASLDIREGPAKFYDYNPHSLEDLPFYVERLPSPGARVLELGCGTGRVSVPLAQHCGFLFGLDLSEAMLDVCRGKVKLADLEEDRIHVAAGDITDFDLGEKFDLIIAPFRVVQNLEADSQVSGLFRCVRRHLSESGRCIVNAFNPNRPPDVLRKEWVSDRENLAWEVKTEEGRIACYDVRRRIDADRLILYPNLVYRRFIGDELAEEAVLTIPMRCYYPGDFLALIESEGFEITGKWGGYSGEEYGMGGELVVEFRTFSG